VPWADSGRKKLPWQGRPPRNDTFSGIRELGLRQAGKKGIVVFQTS
jgi:hypothetical protein